MPRFSQILVAALLLVALSTSSAFTPDAAFKMKTLLGTAQTSSATVVMEGTNKKGVVVPPPTGSVRNTQLSLIGQENIRKSITVPPSYEDYMTVRQNALQRLLQRGNNNNDFSI